MRLIYNFAIRVLFLVMRFSRRRDPKAKKWIEGRKGLLKKVAEATANIENPVWVHCASLGEFEQGRPLIESIKEKFPGQKVVLSFFSPSGYEVRKNYEGADFVFYLPLDTRRNSRKIVKLIKPKVVFFIKYEYWFNLLRSLKKRKIPIYFVSSIFRTDQAFFKWYGGWYRRLLKMPTHFFVQNNESVELLRKYKITNVSVSGDTRFDRVARVVKSAHPLPLVEKFLDGQKVIIVGSSWKAEEALLMQYLRIRNNLKVIIAPHEVNQESISRLDELFGEKMLLYSDFSKGAPLLGKQVLIIDCYGMLTSLYQYGKIAIIGGGFGVGIHNTLEAATFGMPIIFGPNYEKFKEAVDMVKRQCAFPVENIEDFNTLLNYLLSNETLVEKLAEMTSGYVRENTGATEIILNKVFQQ
jgi:3-deoxy-D-manno-octulosonic-acid transferase